MKRIILIFITIFLFPYSKSNAQIEEDWQGFKVSIPFIRVMQITTLYEPSKWQTKVYPPVTTTVVCGYEFFLEMTVSIHSSNELFDKIIPIIFNTPDGKKTIHNFNEEQAPLRTNNLYTFNVTIQSKDKGYLRVGFLRKFSDSPELQEIYEYGLRLE